MKIAVVQKSSYNLDYNKNIEIGINSVKEAKTLGADIVLFPECFITGYTLPITKEQAIAIIALWGNCNQQQRITLEKGFECFKSLYGNIEISECTWEQYIKVISDLEKIGSLKLDDDGIWLCEWVSKKYTR